MRAEIANHVKAYYLKRHEDIAAHVNGTLSLLPFDGAAATCEGWL